MKHAIFLILLVLCSTINNFQFMVSAINNHYDRLEESFETREEAEDNCIIKKIKISRLLTEEPFEYCIYQCIDNFYKYYLEDTAKKNCVKKNHTNGLFYCRKDSNAKRIKSMWRKIFGQDKWRNENNVD